ncbi:hypothetical protein AXG93_2035s1680 [Marchantia polymorpha subsp. ruderalis]|uniref:Uncharacterized protein n=1 Tax=Marchantia polymorpha subsp. ruderalis TaxID=1480154 RepID=A0A176VPG3_MARPO|nr:hypothetical protein AXG93_2035s1680 [Marchantia polymorpha subsp. ruderalis]
MVEIMQSCWAFSIGADESNDEGGDPHLDLRIRIPLVVGYDGEAKIQHDFHLLAIPLFSLAHTSQTYADIVIKMLDSLSSNWRMKLIGSSTDEVGNMVGHTGLASVMPTTNRVEADFSFMNYRKNEYNSNLSDYSLEGVMFARQFKQLDSLISYIYD